MEPIEIIMGIVMCVVLLLVGGFCIFCSVMNFDWFFNNYKAAPLVKIFGRNGTRIFYIIIGVFILNCDSVKKTYNVVLGNLSETTSILVK